MVVRKRMLVLANSVKFSQRCIAGREVRCDGTRYRLGDWLRPISRYGQGELAVCERRYADGRLVAVLDVVDVTLAARSADPFQPENWQIDDTGAWADATADFRLPCHKWFLERPENLWLEPGNRSDRVTHVWLTAHLPRQSLVVVRPESLSIRLLTDTENDFPRVKRRCRFVYAGVEYDMGLTDPVIAARYEAQVPGPRQPALNLRLPCGDDALVCVSLANEFFGHHYKVVATIFEGSS